MSNFKVNLKRLVETLPVKWVNVLTPIIEWIVNGINSIDERKKIDKNFKYWKIEVIIEKKLQIDWKESWWIDFLKIIDNWIWFNKENFESFNEAYSAKKVDIWWKWFWRLTYLKYFKTILVNSTYYDNWFKNIIFNFWDNWIYWESILDWWNEYFTEIKFEYPEKVFSEWLNEKCETVARKLSEHLLSFLLDSNCPDIIIKLSWNSINLKEYIKRDDCKILLIKEIDKDIFWKNFRIYIYKFYFPEKDINSINLVAHNRVVTTTNLSKYIPEFEDIFTDKINKKWKEKTENYAIKIYIKSDLFDKSVNTIRNKFDFEVENLENNFSQEDIEKQIVEVCKKFYPEDLKSRFEDKIENVKEKLKNEMPRYQSFLAEGIEKENLNNLPNKPTNKDITIYFEKIRFDKEILIWDLTKEILDSDKDIREKEEELFKNLHEVSKNQLVHYICLRKIILDLFQKYLELNEEWEYEKEIKIHNLIFPMWWTSYDTKFEKNNVWLIDENLIYSSDIFSDKSIKAEDKKRTEPDVMIFRERNDTNSPVYIIEFKRPWRINYKDNPIEQLAWYVDRLRNNQETTSAWRRINIDEKTPIYCYFIWDLTEEVLKKMKTSDPIELERYGCYYWYNKWDNYYFYALSFDYIYKTANQRNKYFFKKLWIDV